PRAPSRAAHRPHRHQPLGRRIPRRPKQPAEQPARCEMSIAPGAGDELQGIKRGIIELADVVVVNKNDGELAPAAKTTATDYSSALRLVRSKTAGWTPRVVPVSAPDGTGIDHLWAAGERVRST